ncbi:hypothetical protein Lgra_1045 [Legionella gratiana]|uniref:Uncharacterized protein n=1 Tax=Legionella gratiana TaxID=45066 RepID=A0A378J110_9GAMM|nr:hypothetical protein [Legionella gratiana]KTD11587.1 hypothetical protein Lgra_1045 [Legionella gratiana]STX41209.1 Uncharacterised protein [Legionella gratiana]
MILKFMGIKYGIMLILVLFIISLAGIEAYQGSLFYYAIFDLSWLAILFTALCCSQTYVIFYIQIMLFLGFWAKLMACLILKVPFIEPTGYWSSNFSSASWDQVLWVSSLAACAILAVNTLFFFCTKNKTKKANKSSAPLWYTKHHNLAWSLILFLGFLTNAINIFFHISITGLRPQLVLPFHLNAVIVWIMALAIPLLMAAFLGWDQSLGQKKNRFYSVCLLAFITSLSSLSRSVYLFWTLPYIIIVLSNLNFSLTKALVWHHRKLIFSFIGYALLSLILVSMGRSYYFAQYHSPSFIGQTSKQLSQLKKLFIGRWVGVEGVMATTAFPQSGWNFFKKGIMEKPSVGDIGIYTREVLKPNNYKNTKKTMFSSLPGLVSILNYTNSPSVVFWGMASICFLLCCFELIIYLALNNKFLLAQLGLILGYWCVSGLNIPYLGVVNLIECLFIPVLLCLINLCYNWLMKFWTKSPIRLKHQELPE